MASGGGIEGEAVDPLTDGPDQAEQEGGSDRGDGDGAADKKVTQPWEAGLISEAPDVESE